MLLVHYSLEPLGEIRSTEQSGGFFTYAKPRGLWLSVEDGEGWRDWCEGEKWGLERLVFKQVVILRDWACILYLRSVEDIDVFTSRYKVEETRNGLYPSYSINWPEVAKGYQGIIIAPYQWDRRLEWDTSWYNGWDCASGCVWDVEAIESVGEAEKLEEKER